MSDFWAKATLKLYTGIGSILYPFTGPFLRARARKGKEDRERRGERYGYASWERPSGPLVWLHAASVGESLAILPLIERMESFGINLVMTTGTVTSADIAQKRLSNRTIHQYVPMDMRRSISRFLDHWKPDLAVFAESEIWPTTIEELAKRNVPQILVNGRMSDRSNARWVKRPKLAHAIFSKISQVIAQSELDGDRFRNLGANRVSVAGNLKIDVGLPVVDEEAAATLKSAIGDRPAWIAVSTHKGEEESVADVHAMLAQHLPETLTILVPRHPERVEEIIEELAPRKLNIVTRSSGKPITADTQIFIGDTIGEMGLFLGLANVAFMGKSLKSQGGQNPIEPAVTGTAILSGKYVQNFRDTYEMLLKNGAARLIADEKMLAGHVLHLLRNPDDCRAMQLAAKETIRTMSGALDKSISALDPFIIPLRVKVGLERHQQSATA